MKILVIGGGGREHALVWAFTRYGHTVACAPGNPGIAALAECLPLALDDHERIEREALERAVDLVVVGPEAPLVAGLADRLRAAGVDVFGPGANGARLEGSKVFCKQFFARHGIRTARFFACSTVADAERAIDVIGSKGTGVVIKADGLAAGKGVVVCADSDQAKTAAREFLEAGRLGEVVPEIVVEERLHGRELSVMAITDGDSLRVLAQAEDHKAIFDGDKGPNTGGMGAVSPCHWVDAGLIERIEREVLAPTLRGLAREGIEYRGVLYAGLMIDRAGDPWTLEYNCRFGDPETQAVLARARFDLAGHLLGAARGRLPEEPMRWDERTAVCVILAAAGYPGKAEVGDVIHGVPTRQASSIVESADGDRDPTNENDDAVVVFHAGTAVRDGELVTCGGRVLGVTALGRDTDDARQRVYRAIASIHFDGMQMRRDIGARAGAAVAAATRPSKGAVMTTPRVAILMGSKSDMSLMAPAAELLRELAIGHEVRIMSAHRTPERTAAYAKSARDRGIAVFICAAGGAAHLAGVVAGHTTLPVIGVPLARTPLAGQDALLATVQMPPGMPVATVAVDGAYNAALLAAQILALSDDAVRARVDDMRAAQTARVVADDLALQDGADPDGGS